MQLSISGKQVDVGAGLKRHVEHHLVATIAKYFDRAIEAQVQFSREAQSIRTDISVHAASGILLQSHAESEDIRASFELAADRVAKRLRRLKRRLIGHQTAKPGPEAQEVMARQVVLSADRNGGDGAAVDAPAPVTIAETMTRIDSLTVSGALERLEAEELQVLLFRNRAHGGFNVVYRRTDGHIGWIDPEDSGRSG
ncbi:MAG: ribosome-associated translation inhibitor RaiA [Alphaproteobacteria bacterium]|jgi:ribosomal subunit interface protein|nr:ribosome-associated translation inhibitor RaiA [Alphaproteobacteria bacterium]MDP6517196.1 ribosome-associated translation inhibitor RaiA [Alphaproteobacteria bacterium]